jgi:hypothetical protein
MSHLAAALRDAIKSETDLYTMRVQQQVNRHCSIIESAAVFGAVDPPKNIQEQIDELRETLNALMGEILQQKFCKSENCSVDNDIIPDEVRSTSNVIVNKMHPAEIKEVHINFDNYSEGASSKSSTGMPAADVDILINNEEVVEAIVEAENEAPASKTSAGAVNAKEEINSVMVEAAVSAAASAKEAESVVGIDDEEDCDEEEVVEDDVEDDAEAEEDAGEEELEVEEIEYKGTKYYKDADENVYECLEDGAVGEAVGTMSKKVAGKVLLYTA